MRPALLAVAHAARKNIRVLTERLVTFGDSTVQGTSSSTNRWAQIRATELGIPLLNQGISGTVMQNRADANGSPRADNGRGRYVSALLGANLSSRYEILYGLNDLRYTGAPATMNLTNFITDYTEVIDGLIAAGVPASSITIGSPIWIPNTPSPTRDGYLTGSTGFTGSSRTVHEQYIAALHQLAFEKGCKYAASYERIRDNGGDSLIAAAPDNIHPTNQGMIEIAAAFAAAAVPTSATWTGGTPIDNTPPTPSSAAVANATPSVVRLTLSEPMNTSFVPAASAFTMGAHTATATAYASSTLLDITVAEPFVFGEAARTLSYTQPGTNNARDVAGNLLANFTGLSITNNVAEVVPPGTPVAATFSSTNGSWRVVSSERYDAGAGTGSTFDGIAQITGSTTVGTDARVSHQYVSNAAPDGSGGVIVLDPTTGLTSFTSNLNRKYLCQLVNTTGAVLFSENSAATSSSALSGGAYSFPSASANNWVSLHMAPSGTVTIETSTDNQATWTVRHTFTTVATGQNFWKLYVTQHRDMYKPMQYGVA